MNGLTFQALGGEIGSPPRAYEWRSDVHPKHQEPPYFGDDAKSLAGRFPDLMVPSIHRLVGISSQSSQLDELRNVFKIPFSIVEPHKARDTLRMVFGTETAATYTTDELLAMVFQSIKRTTERTTEQTYHGEPVQAAVITVPQFFTVRQRQAIVDAAAMAGIRVLSLMHPPTAAALQYGIQNNGFDGQPKKVVMLDMGSMSTHVGVYEYSGVGPGSRAGKDLWNITTLALVSSSSLGGKSVDACVARLIDAEASASLRIQPVLSGSTAPTDATQRKAVHSLMRAANKVKEMLSANRIAPYTVEGIKGDKDFSSKMTRETFEQHCVPTDALLKFVDEALVMAGISTAEITSSIDRFEIIGGGARIPKLLEDIKNHLFQGTRDVDRTTNSDEAAAIGAGYRAAFLSNVFVGVPSFSVFDDFALSSEVSIAVGASVPQKLFGLGTNNQRHFLPAQKVLQLRVNTESALTQAVILKLTLLTEQASRYSASTGLKREESLVVEKISDCLQKVSAMGSSSANITITDAFVRALFVYTESGLYFPEAIDFVVAYNKTENLTSATNLVGDEEQTPIPAQASTSKVSLFSLPFVREFSGTPKPIDPLEALSSQRRLSVLQAVDDEKLAIAAARNDLETFALWVRTDSIFDEAQGLFKNTEITPLQMATKETVDWLEMEAADDTPKTVFISKRFALRTLVHKAAFLSDKLYDRKCKLQQCALAAVRQQEPRLSTLVEASLTDREDLDSLLSNVGEFPQENEAEDLNSEVFVDQPRQEDDVEEMRADEVDVDEMDEL